jgi:hypothetical protein
MICIFFGYNMPDLDGYGKIAANSRLDSGGYSSLGRENRGIFMNGLKRVSCVIYDVNPTNASAPGSIDFTLVVEAGTHHWLSELLF